MPALQPTLTWVAEACQCGRPTARAACCAAWQDSLQPQAPLSCICCWPLLNTDPTLVASEASPPALTGAGGGRSAQYAVSQVSSPKPVNPANQQRHGLLEAARVAYARPARKHCIGYTLLAGSTQPCTWHAGTCTAQQATERGCMQPYT